MDEMGKVKATDAAAKFIIEELDLKEIQLSFEFWNNRDYVVAHNPNLFHRECSRDPAVENFCELNLK